MSKVKTTSYELRGTQALRAIFSIDLANHGKLKVGPEYYSVKHKPHALLIEPLNANPYVLINLTAEQAPDTISLPIVQRIEWEPKAGSGTDFLRARIEAGLFFDELPDRPTTRVPSGALIIQSLESAVKPRLGPCQMHDQASQESLEREVGDNASLAP